jgi:YHS domain-containing protein
MKLTNLVILVFLTGTVFAQKEVYTKFNAAIDGYDPVAYFKESKPVKGRKEFSYVWKGASWNFSNAQNMNEFKSNPEAFAPQFGGYCAYGVADGHKATTSPDAWTIVEGKLYFNYDKGVQALWNKDQKGYIKIANERWPTVKKEKD